ncbi:hypothetical protein [Vibrio diabolicus]|uniref:hypothetical protein n=1 Tax=Vibrio diabolicus TaxID=50719 RepID=UPI0037505E7D
MKKTEIKATTMSKAIKQIEDSERYLVTHTGGYEYQVSEIKGDVYTPSFTTSSLSDLKRKVAWNENYREHDMSFSEYEKAVREGHINM